MKTVILTFISVFLFQLGFSQADQSAESQTGIAVGTKAPTFSALKADSTTFTLNDALKKGPVVLIFYRGHWCPVCNKHLANIQDSLKMVTALGASVVAVSPQKPEYLDKMSKKSGATFNLLYDENYLIANAYGVSFKPKTSQLMVYNNMLNAKLKKSQSDKSQTLPIPATYIINKDGTIIWRQFDPNYKNRSSVKDIIATLTSQK